MSVQGHGTPEFNQPEWHREQAEKYRADAARFDRLGMGHAADVARRYAWNEDRIATELEEGGTK